MYHLQSSSSCTCLLSLPSCFLLSCTSHTCACVYIQVHVYTYKCIIHVVYTCADSRDCLQQPSGPRVARAGKTGQSHGQPVLAIHKVTRSVHYGAKFSTLLTALCVALGECCLFVRRQVLLTILRPTTRHTGRLASSVGHREVMCTTWWSGERLLTILQRRDGIFSL